MRVKPSIGHTAESLVPFMARLPPDLLGKCGPRLSNCLFLVIVIKSCCITRIAVCLLVSARKSFIVHLGLETIRFRSISSLLQRRPRGLNTRSTNGFTMVVLRRARRPRLQIVFVSALVLSITVWMLSAHRPAHPRIVDEAQLRRKFPLAYKHIHTFQGVGGGNCPFITVTQNPLHNGIPYFHTIAAKSATLTWYLQLGTFPRHGLIKIKSRPKQSLKQLNWLPK